MSERKIRRFTVNGEVKTAGQIAYEQYCKATNNRSLVSGAKLPSWNILNPKIRDAWECSSSDLIGVVLASLSNNDG